MIDVAHPNAVEVNRERCHDEDGNLYTVIVWRNDAKSSSGFYTLDDGTPLHYEDECYFAMPNFKFLSRCDDQ